MKYFKIIFIYSFILREKGGGGGGDDKREWLC